MSKFCNLVVAIDSVCKEKDHGVAHDRGLQEGLRNNKEEGPDLVSALAKN